MIDLLMQSDNLALCGNSNVKNKDYSLNSTPIDKKNLAIRWAAEQ